MGIGVWYEMKISNPVSYLFENTDPEGSLRIEGQVLTSDQLPVGGAIVSIDSRPPRFTTSEEDGSFAFDKLVGKPYDLVARSKEGVAGPITALSALGSARFTSVRRCLEAMTQ